MAVADQQTLGDPDPHEEVVLLEEHIEKLAAKLESCPQDSFWPPVLP